MKGGGRWICVLKGGKEKRLTTVSCLRQGITVLRVFIVFSFLFSIFIFRGDTQLAWDHIKLVIVWVGEVGFPDFQISGL